MPVQKQTVGGQLTRFKVFVAIGDYSGQVGLGIKCSKELASAIQGVTILVKLSIILARRSYGEQDWEDPHYPVHGDRLLWLCAGASHPCPQSTGISSAPVPTKPLMMAGIDDCYTSGRGCAAILDYFAKATFDAIFKTYSYLTRTRPLEH
uniref:Rps2r1 n=1 Tax=Rattus norvegicus TaxID=10116 RepID=O35805_RAT|nr:Rps2r1 [Rattus norvegicus]